MRGKMRPDDNCKVEYFVYFNSIGRPTTEGSRGSVRFPRLGMLYQPKLSLVLRSAFPLLVVAFRFMNHA